MSLRRPRSHTIGISNIDFRSKKDEKSLRIFEPWQAPKDFGTMGYKNYKNPRITNKELFSATKRINTHKDIVNDYPDPRYFTTAQFYKDNNISIKTKSFINSERVSNLEETFKGKEPFIGDGMGIVDIINQRKGKKERKIQINVDTNISEEQKQQIQTENLANDKKRINKNVLLETQITKIDTNKTDNDLVDMNKIVEIRQAIRRRYGNRKKTNKIFQQWARTFPNKITVYDAYKMINSLNIPINYNETRALIASGSNLGNEYLNMEEFSNLIFNKNEENYESPWTEHAKTKNFLEEKEQKTLNNIIIDNNKQINDKVNLTNLKDFISERTITFIKNLKEISKDKYLFTNIENNEKINLSKNNLNKCNYDKFSQAVLSLNPSKNFSDEKYIKKLFNEYKDKDNLVDIRYFVNNLFEKNSKEYMTKLKDNITYKFKEQVEEKRNSLQKYISENKNQKNLIFQKKYDLDKQLLLKKEIQLKEKENEKITNEINSTVPSTIWIHHIYDNRNECYNSLNRAEHALSAKSNVKQYFLKANTRFGANPVWRNTSEILIGDKFSSTYINEKDRFNLNRDVGKDDKRKNEQIKIGRENRIKTAIQKYEENNYVKQFLREEKAKYSQYEKSRKLLDYEELFKKRNFLIE